MCNDITISVLMIGSKFTYKRTPNSDLPTVTAIFKEVDRWSKTLGSKGQPVNQICLYGVNKFPIATTNSLILIYLILDYLPQKVNQKTCGFLRYSCGTNRIRWYLPYRFLRFTALFILKTMSKVMGSRKATHVHISIRHSFSRLFLLSNEDCLCGLW